MHYASENKAMTYMFMKIQFDSLERKIELLKGKNEISEEECKDLKKEVKDAKTSFENAIVSIEIIEKQKQGLNKSKAELTALMTRREKQSHMYGAQGGTFGLLGAALHFSALFSGPVFAPILIAASIVCYIASGFGWMASGIAGWFSKRHKAKIDKIDKQIDEGERISSGISSGLSKELVRIEEKIENAERLSDSGPSTETVFNVMKVQQGAEPVPEKENGDIGSSITVEHSRKL